MSNDQGGDDIAGGIDNGPADDGHGDDPRDPSREPSRDPFRDPFLDPDDVELEGLLTDDDLALLLSAPELWASPSDDVEDRIVAAIAAERDAMASAGPATNRVAPVVGIDTARRRRQRWLVPAAAALIGAAAAALVTVAVVPSDDEPTADATITLAGTDLATGIDGTAAVTTETSGVRIVIHAAGLPRRDGGEFYEGWLKSCDGTELVPIGSFHELDEAIGWAGVDIATHPLLTVTRETVAGPKDPAQGSSGEVVVSGALTPCPAP